jgi:hypothetical protein
LEKIESPSDLESWPSESQIIQECCHLQLAELRMQALEERLKYQCE